jgi:hypothetical protein
VRIKRIRAVVRRQVREQNKTAWFLGPILVGAILILIPCFVSLPWFVAIPMMVGGFGVALLPDFLFKSGGDK